MKFNSNDVSCFSGNIINESTGTSKGISVFMLNGKLYAGADGWTYGHLTTVDFTADNNQVYWTGGRADGLSNISERNANGNLEGDCSVDAAIPLVAHIVNDIHAAVIDGKTYVAVATNGGVSVINETDGVVYDIAFTSRITTTLHLTSQGDLYINSNAGGSYYSEVAAFYNVQNISSDKTYEQADKRYYNFGSYTTPALPRVSNADVIEIYVTEGTSIVDGTSNTIYAADENGITVLQEKQGDESNGSVKYITSDYISEELIGDIRGMWPFYSDTAGSIANGTNNIDDVSVKASELTAKNANGTGMNYVKGVRGTAIKFDGTDDYLCTDTNDDDTCDEDTDLDITGSLTVGAWVKRGSSGTADAIISKYDHISGDQRSYYLRFEVDDYIKFGITPDGTYSSIETIQSTETYSDQNWHHVAATYDGSTISLYVNGKYDGGGSSSGIVHSTSQFRIGGHNTGGWETSRFKGFIDEVNFMQVVDKSPLSQRE